MRRFRVTNRKEGEACISFTDWPTLYEAIATFAKIVMKAEGTGKDISAWHIEVVYEKD